MKISDFNEGDIVQLKSGGPKMTVTSIWTDGDLKCQWFSGSKLQYGRFNQNSLLKVEDTDE